MGKNRELKRMGHICMIFFLALLATISLNSYSAKRLLSFKDIMMFKEILDPLISDDGNWVVYNSQPDRGNGEVIVTNVNTRESFVIDRGNKPVISKDGKWVASFIKPDALKMEKAKKKEKLKQGMVLLETSTGKKISFEKIKEFSFSDNSRWLLYHRFPEEENLKKDDKYERAIDTMHEPVGQFLDRHYGRNIIIVGIPPIDADDGEPEDESKQFLPVPAKK